jgi:hypothetical protein
LLPFCRNDLVQLHFVKSSGSERLIEIECGRGGKKSEGVEVVLISIHLFKYNWFRSGTYIYIHTSDGLSTYRIVQMYKYYCTVFYLVPYQRYRTYCRIRDTNQTFSVRISSFFTLSDLFPGTWIPLTLIRPKTRDQPQWWIKGTGVVGHHRTSSSLMTCFLIEKVFLNLEGSKEGECNHAGFWLFCPSFDWSLSWSVANRLSLS